MLMEEDWWNDPTRIKKKYRLGVVVCVEQDEQNLTVVTQNQSLKGYASFVYQGDMVGTFVRAMTQELGDSMLVDVVNKKGDEWLLGYEQGKISGPLSGWVDELHGGICVCVSLHVRRR